MKTAKERLNYILKECGMSRAELSRLSDIPYNRIRDICSGKTKVITYEVATKAAKVLGVNVDWLQNGGSDVETPIFVECEDPNKNEETDNRMVDTAGLPFIGDTERVTAGPLAGDGRGLTAQDITDRIMLPGLSWREGDFALRVRGRSMIDRQHPDQNINDGAIICLRPWRERHIQWGEIYCIATRDGFTVKRLMPAQEGYVRFVSSNVEEDYAPYDVATEDIVGIAKVTAIINTQVLV